MEQRANIKFCYKLGKTATKTREMLEQVYGREAVSGKCVYEWFKCFREGKETTEDEPRLSLSSTSRTPEVIEKVRQMLAQNRLLTVRLIAEELGINKERRTPSSAMIWVSGRSPDLCRTSSQTSRKQNGWKLLDTSFPCVTRIHCFWKTSSREMRPGAISSIRNQNCNDGMVFTDFPAVKKESFAKIHGQNTVDRLLRQQSYYP